jgi:hypothetical protein
MSSSGMGRRQKKKDGAWGTPVPKQSKEKGLSDREATVPDGGRQR